MEYSEGQIRQSRMSDRTKRIVIDSLITQWRWNPGIVEASAEHDSRPKGFIGMVCVMEFMTILFVRSVSQPPLPFVPFHTKTPQDSPISCGVFLIPLFFYHMTSYFMPRLHFSENRCFLSAFFCRIRTACGERTALKIFGSDRLFSGKLVRKTEIMVFGSLKKGHSQSALLLAHNKNEIAKQSHFR